MKTKDTAPVDVNVNQLSCPQTQHEDLSEGNNSSQTTVNQSTVSARTDDQYHDTQPTVSGGEKLFADLSLSEIPQEGQPFFQNLKEIKFTEIKMEEEKEAKQMLWEELRAFSQHPDDIVCVPDLLLKINTEDEILVQRSYNAIPRHKYAKVKTQILNMLDKGWMQKSVSPWASPIVLAKRKMVG